jgi:hypothetical protein
MQERNRMKNKEGKFKRVKVSYDKETKARSKKGSKGETPLLLGERDHFISISIDSKSNREESDKGGVSMLTKTPHKNLCNSSSWVAY